jgi:hypothetical protein
MEALLREAAKLDASSAALRDDAQDDSASA